MTKSNKKKRKSKGMGRLRRNRKRSIKLNRKFNKKKTRRRRRRRRQSGGAWKDWVPNFFVEESATENANILPKNPAAKQTQTFLNQMGEKLDNVNERIADVKERVSTAATAATNMMKKPELKGDDLSRIAMSDFKKLEVDFKKLKDQFGVIGEWINKRTKDPAKCPCCKQAIQDNVLGKGAPMVQQPPGTLTPPPAPTARPPQVLGMGPEPEPTRYSQR